MATLRWLSRNLRQVASDCCRKLRSDRQGRELKSSQSNLLCILRMHSPLTHPDYAECSLPCGPEANWRARCIIRRFIVCLFFLSREEKNGREGGNEVIHVPGVTFRRSDSYGITGQQLLFSLLSPRALWRRREG